MTYAVGSLVRARGREWVVLPESEGDLLVLRPLGGTEDEVTGIYRSLEPVEPARFDLPDPEKPGDHRSCRLLRDAVRLGFRSSAGPFRSFGRIAVDPRPYQLVPLLMALKLDPVRLLIADDVGIGKTIEACLIVRELLDRGEVTRSAVLCPPHLAEQWQAELSSKFHVEAELVLASTAARLERGLAMDESLFNRHPHVIVSMDFIKSDRRRDEFLRNAPELVIVDEAHTCVFTGEGRSGRHQRHQLVRGLAADASRHLILVTATPHSGKEEAFRALLALLSSDFASLPEDLGGRENEQQRYRLAAHFVQRRRADIRHYMRADTQFPGREEREETYKLSDDYRKMFDRVLAYARETVRDEQNNQHRQRVRWWSALALLRSLASSPAAAAATLRNRAATADTETSEAANEVGRRTVLDLEDESAEGTDVAPGGDIGELAADEKQNRSRLLKMAVDADALMGDNDEKLLKALKLLKLLLEDGYRPIVFCRFIPTAEYLAAELRKRLPSRVTISAVTGLLPPAERERRILDLDHPKDQILVCTDCLSEGINLQKYFDAVLHYDLSWNPTRHEQREGRVDRFGQNSTKVRLLTYYGLDNQIDGIVLDVLIRKHRTIRNSLGISVAVPIDTDSVVEAIFEGLLLRESSGTSARYLPGFDAFFKPKKEELFAKWEDATAREKRSRTVFAQQSIKVEEVAAELETVRAAIGSGIDVGNFVREGFRAHGALVSGNGKVRVDLSETPRALREAVDRDRDPAFEACFEPPVGERVLHLRRTHPIVEGLASYVTDTALDPRMDGAARRCGAIRTAEVQQRTTVLLVRFRYHIVTRRGVEEHPLLAEDCQLLAFTGSPENAKWLETDAIDKVIQSAPAGNVLPEQAADFVRKVTDGFPHIAGEIDQVARRRGQVLLEAHRRVRVASRARGVSHHVEPQLPPDILGIYIYLPKS